MGGCQSAYYNLARKHHSFSLATCKYLDLLPSHNLIQQELRSYPDPHIRWLNHLTRDRAAMTTARLHVTTPETRETSAHREQNQTGTETETGAIDPGRQTGATEIEPTAEQRVVVQEKETLGATGEGTNREMQADEIIAEMMDAIVRRIEVETETAINVQIYGKAETMREVISVVERRRQRHEAGVRAVSARHKGQESRKIMVSIARLHPNKVYQCAKGRLLVKQHHLSMSNSSSTSPAAIPSSAILAAAAR